MVLLAALAVAAFSMSVASATSLGLFDDVVLSSAATDAPVCAPVVDTIDASQTVLGLTTSVTLVALVDLPALSSTILGSVHLSGISADCVGMVPVIFVVGQDALALSDPVILSRSDLAALPTAAATQTRPISGTLDIGVLTTITEIRVVMRPASA